MSFLAVIILAILQGLTEFLPVSSSGHLSLAGSLMNLPSEDMSFEVVVHLGTLLAVLAVYWKDLVSLAGGILRWEREALNLAGLLILGSIPAATAGLLLSGQVEALFGKPAFVSSMLLVTGTVLFLTRFVGSRQRKVPSPMGAIMIGISQALALLPGISRSGFTISTGLFMGIRRSEAARFSFLLSIPAILGAAILKVPDAGSGSVSTGYLLLGLAVSAVTGYLALRVLLGFLSRGRFSVFSWYCWVVGAAGLALTLTGA